MATIQEENKSMASCSPSFYTPRFIIGLFFFIMFKPEISVPIQTSRRDKGDHVMIVHFYQPNHPLVNVSVSVDNSYKGSFHATNCPSISGCRSIVRFETGETFDYADSRTINFQLAQNGKDIWLDYVLFAPAANVNPDLLKGAPVDFTDEFLNKCASQHFKVDPEVSKFCDESVFALSTRYNNGAESCGCDPNGSLSTQCDKLGGQCECKENVIGRQCSRCKTGFYGFPNCKECNCPSGNCDDQTGSCICAQNVEEGTCSKCVPGTYGFDPYFGCDDCDCNLDGTVDGNGVCNPDSGQCDCKTNLDGRRCDVCKAGFYNYPQCFECSCNANGTIDRICDPNYANCLCKDNVNGPNCDQCEYGTFNLESRNPKGCTNCFCFGFTDHCISSHYYFRIVSHMNASDWKLSNYKSSQATLVENGNLFCFQIKIIETWGRPFGFFFI
jgi:laminin alpha 3/5